MDNDEICSLIISFSVLLVWDCKILEELMNNVKNNIGKFNNNQLVQLASSGKYIFSSEKYSEIYRTIHDACVNSKQRFNDNQIRILRKIYTDDSLISNSIFIK